MFKMGIGLLLFGILLANFGLEGGVSSIIALTMGFIGFILIIANATNDFAKNKNESKKANDNNGENIGGQK